MNVAAPGEITVQKDQYGRRELVITVGSEVFTYAAFGEGEKALKHLAEYPDDADLPYTLT